MTRLRSPTVAAAVEGQDGRRAIAARAANSCDGGTRGHAFAQGVATGIAFAVAGGLVHGLRAWINRARADRTRTRAEEWHLRGREKALLGRLQALEAAKSAFMSTVSHELRTPLTSISGYLELMREGEPGDLNDAQDRMLEVIARNTRRLRDLVEDILTLSRIESGSYRTELERLDLAPLIDRAVAAVAPLADKSAVQLRCEVRRPLELRGDGIQLVLVLANLLGNAVKFTPAEGTVTVRARRSGKLTVVEVADTGMGVPIHEQPALFVRFFRATNAIRQAIPGAGLGLTIVRRIIENHGGTIDIDSAENAGTVVTVRLPAV